MALSVSRDPSSGPVGANHSTELNQVLTRNWGLLVWRGAIAIVFGLIALFVPTATILALVLLFSAYMLVDGVFGIVAAYRAARRHDHWGLLALQAVVDLAAGVIAFVWPGITAIAFVLLLAAWSLLSGGLQLGMAFRVDGAHGRWWLALGGVVSIIFGVLLVIAPVLGLLVVTWWLGAYAIILGVALLVFAFRLRARRSDPAPGGAAAAAP